VFLYIFEKEGKASVHIQKTLTNPVSTLHRLDRSYKLIRID
jgi:hypothetical protein